MGNRVGSSGNPIGTVILATTNGGATWTAQDASAAGSAAYLDSVDFANANAGWAVGGTVDFGGPLILASSTAAAAGTASSKGADAVVASSKATALWLIVAVIVGLMLIVALGVAVAIRRRKATGVVAAPGSLVPDARDSIGDTGQPGAAQAGGDTARFCTSCGSSVGGGAGFCASCGAKVIR